MNAVNPASLKSAFDTATSYGEWSTGVVVVGLIIEFVALLFFGKEMSKWEKMLLVVGSVVVVIGVGGEYTFSGRAATAAKGLQRASEERMADLASQQAHDHKIAAKAAADAASLGVSVSGLHNFVTTQEAQNKAVIDALTRKTADLNKVRADALAAAEKSQNDLIALNDALARQKALTSKIEAATEKLEQRHVSEAQKRQLRDLLAKWAVVPGAGEFSGKTPLGGKQVALVLQYPDTEEGAAFAKELRDAIKGAGWNACCDGFSGANQMIGNTFFPALAGITVAATDSPRSNEVADALVNALNAVGLKARKYDRRDELASGCDKTPLLAQKLPGCAVVSVFVGEHP